MTSPKSAPEKRGDRARAEMRAKGYVQLGELSEKLTAELGRKITRYALKGMHERGRLDGGILHEDANIWFFPLDTQLPENLNDKRKKRDRLRQMHEEPRAAWGPWANWPAP